MKKLIAAAALAIGTFAAVPASAAIVVLNFEGINSTYPSTNYANILNFYSGGTSSQGTSGTNYGISFGSNALAICLNTPTGSCSNTSRGGFGDPTSQRGGLFFLDGSQTFMNIAAGFDTGFSFFYAAINSGGSLGVYDGLNGTGNLLATIVLGTTTSGPCPGYAGGFCPFVAGGIAFTGIAHSVSFGGVANQIVFDDLTFGSAIPNPPSQGVPEPESIALIGLGLVALSTMRLRRSAKSKQLAQ